MRRTSVVSKGDWRPLIILLTDGQATDNWSLGVQRLGQNAKPRPANIYAIGCGDDVDVAELRELTDIVLHLPEMGEDQIRKLFVWLTASVTETSRGVHETETGMGINLSKLPESIVKVDHTVAARSGPQRQVFLYARCSKSRQPYLMRYRYEEEYGVYLPVTSHRMESEAAASRETFALPPISSEQLDGTPPCPYCAALGAGSCSNCGTVFCNDLRNFNDVVCPGCQNVLKSRSPNERQRSFDIRQSLS